MSGELREAQSAQHRRAEATRRCWPRYLTLIPQLYLHGLSEGDDLDAWAMRRCRNGGAMKERWNADACGVAQSWIASMGGGAYCLEREKAAILL